MAKAPVDIRSLARAHTERAIQVLAGIMRDGTLESARVAAANSLLDRGWGKPAQAIVGDDTLDAISLRMIVTGVQRPVDNASGD